MKQNEPIVIKVVANGVIVQPFCNPQEMARVDDIRVFESLEGLRRFLSDHVLFEE